MYTYRLFSKKSGIDVVKTTEVLPTEGQYVYIRDDELRHTHTCRVSHIAHDLGNTKDPEGVEVVVYVEEDECSLEYLKMAKLRKEAGTL